MDGETKDFVKEEVSSLALPVQFPEYVTSAGRDWKEEEADGARFTHEKCD